VTPTPKFAALVTAMAVALIAGILLGRPDLAAVGAAFAVSALRAWTSPAPRILAAHGVPTRNRLVEGDQLGVTVELDVEHAARSTVTVAAPDQLAPRQRTLTVACRPGAHVELPFAATRWGRAELGPLRITVLDRANLRSATAEVADVGTVRVLPSRQRLEALIDPARTQARAGTLVSRERGEGSELAELRLQRPGDPARRVAWRASARRGRRVVADRLADRNADVVLLLDTFADVSSGGDGTLGVAVRTAASLAERYLERMDRVVVVGFGGVVHWLPPSMGSAAAYRIVDALVDSEALTSYAWKDISVVPRRIIPARALVVGLSPLVDPRGVGALVELRGRGFDVVVFDVSPEPFLPAPQTRDEHLGRRLWRLRRDTLRARLERSGAPVVTVSAARSLEQSIEEVRQWRRYAAHASQRAL
jgi:uncharacterized protein (DUF58 family)